MTDRIQSHRPGRSHSAEHAFAAFDPRGARGRLALAAVAGVIAGALDDAPWMMRVIAGWDVGAGVLLVLAWWLIVRAGPDETRRRAGAEDPGRTAVWVLVLLASAFSLFAATVALRRAKELAQQGCGDLVALSLGAVAGAWLLTHTAYTLRYARLYYRDDDEGVGGLEFPGKRPPDDFDFAYFAFTIGMCFQVSDVTISSHVIRRHVLVHAVISFAYNTTLFALALNLLLGFLG